LIGVNPTTTSMSLFLYELQVPPIAEALPVMLELPMRTLVPAEQETPGLLPWTTLDL
jgi:hypothetical protein